MEEAKNTIKSIQAELDQAFSQGGGNKEGFLAILNSNQSINVIKAIDEEVAKLVNTTDGGTEAARKFIAQILEVTNAKKEYEELNQHLQQTAQKLDEMSNKNKTVKQD